MNDNAETKTPVGTCTLCGEQLTFARWFTSNCPKGDQLQAIGHNVPDWTEIKAVCPECREWRWNDERVAAGQKCASCAGYGEE